MASETSSASRESGSRDQDPNFVQKAFTSIAPRYVLTNHILSMGIDVSWRKKVAAIVSERNPDFVLDVATGSGDLAAEVWKTCPEARIVGVDFCAPMLEHAKKRGLPELLVADGMDLPFDDASVDVITIGYGLRNMESWSGAVSEFSRVLKPDGTLVILDFSLPTNPLLRAPYRFYLHHILPLIAGVLTGNRGAYQYLGESIERFPKGADMTSMLMKNGYRKAEAIPLAGGISSVYVADK
ncbi:MAG: bifunctional demethylmenaquinone methyltransferase/2-methoxy-6-polyprenyl-1,4-benzoquinol methylase UbiE [Verrucomicrobiales bacterium]|nr:bifunctional demethylmenaquinone methyltransferase/2-methoxy-6-polyprenyl-1,4-benzoquinol methylase UbiE [Verrucomicrobiales bacterium]